MVDDDPHMLFSTARMLKQGGFLVFEGSCAADAIALTAKHHPALLLLDVDLPDGNGVDIAFQIKHDSTLCSTFVILYSGIKISMEDKVEGLGKGLADGYIIKPIIKDELLALIDSFIRIRAVRESLRKSLSFQEVLLSALPVPLFYADNNGRYIGGNQLFTEFSGLPLNDKNGKKIDTSAPEGLGLVEEIDTRLFHSPGIQVQEGPLPDGKGVAHDVILHLASFGEEGGKVQGFIGAIIDITERKRMEDALVANEKKLGSILNDITDVVWSLSWPDMNVHYISPSVEKVYGRAVQEFIDKPSLWAEVTHPDDKQISDRALEQLLKTGSAIRECRIVRPDGSIVWVYDKSKFIFGENDTPIRVDGITSDITDRKQVEEKIKSALAEKEVLLSEVHHRVKNYFAEIIGLIGLQLGTLNDPVTVSQFKAFEVRIRSMAIVHELLDTAKDFARVNLATYMENLTSYLFQMYTTKTKVNCRIDMGDLMLPFGTTIPFGLVISEIVTNSLKYAFPDTFYCKEKCGELCIITLSLKREGSDYLLIVADNGIGMSEEVEVTSSNSLGLYLIRLIVEHQLQGSIEISTTVGTMYTIRFPEPAVKTRYFEE